MMKSSLIVIIVLLFVLTAPLSLGIRADRPSTCEEFRREITFLEEEIRNLSLTLEECRLVRGSEEKEESDECNEYETCSACMLQRTESLCGWCVLRNKCTLQENCRDNGHNLRFWVTGIERCPKIRAVKPPHVPAGTAEMLQILMPLPEYYGVFLCSFEVLGKTLLTKGMKTNETEERITCATPHILELPEIPKNNVEVPVKLSVRIPGGPSLASTDFVIYDCGRYDSCSECSASHFPCAWCVEGNRCTHSVNDYCRNDIIVFSKAVNRPTLREGPAYCPRIVPPSSMPSNEIPVPSGKEKRILIKVENVVHIQAQSRFFCEIKGVGRVRAQLLADVIYCDSMTFNVTDRKRVTELPFNVYWDGNRKLDNTQNVHVTVYHCGSMATNCNECMALRKRFDCGWCEASHSCTVYEDCEASPWMNKEENCTKPQITSFYPKSGLRRRTSVTLTGVNFGTDFNKINRIRLLTQDGIVITECTPLDYSSKENVIYQVTCQLGIPKISAENDEVIRGSFELKIAGRFVAISAEEYYFVNPNLIRFEPTKGIKSGGTFLKIKGHNLDAGSKVEVFIGDLPCNITGRTSSRISCTTSPSLRTRSSEVRVIFDGEERKLATYYFYVEDPYIRSVKSANGANAPVGTQSGGNLIIVEGENFDHVPNPYIYIIADGVEYPGGCTLESDKRMECFSPRIPADVLNFCSGDGYVVFDYGFKMGDVQDVQNISLKKDFEKFRIYPDPFFMPFTEKKMTKIFKSDYLTIRGRYLTSVFDENDISVSIGAEECIVTSLSQTQLVCKPPAVQPKAMDGDANKLPDVVVRVQGKQEFIIGFLRYDDI